MVRECFVFFSCNHKTASEIRISDWSSDVCSSDLEPHTVISGPRNRYEGIRSSGALRRRRIDIPPKLYRAQQKRDRYADLDSSTLHKSVTQFGRGNGGALASRSRESSSIRSRKRRVGQECVSTGRNQWAPEHEKKK